MHIPWQSLPPSTLQNILESYIDREGTDYGFEEASRDDKVVQLKQLLQTGEIVILWCEDQQSVDLKPADWQPTV